MIAKADYAIIPPHLNPLPLQGGEGRAKGN